MNISDINTPADLLAANTVTNPMDSIEQLLPELTPVQVHELMLRMCMAQVKFHKHMYNESGRDCWLVDGVTFTHIGRLLDTIDWD